ncbi:MAG TPA: c-type cytochrome [Bryobacteraceae bacterium]|nr:c-type cytochrome [Bryobacteraceae bacterium]
MRPLLLLIAAVTAARAQDAAVERGAQLYRTNCAVPYCHGPDGAAGRAPRLIGHSYSLNGMFKVISWGIPGTGMPEFTSRLKTPEINDLVAFVMTLRGSPSAAAPAPAAPPKALTPEAKAGRALFFDAARTGNCGTCHELDGWGVAIGPDLATIKDLRDVPVRHVVTARPTGGDVPFPALVAERTDTRIRVYDLSASIPVLRTFAPSRVVIEPSTSWRHEQMMHAYTANELQTIATYLRLR